jgi:hypothetical protein
VRQDYYIELLPGELGQIGDEFHAAIPELPGIGERHVLSDAAMSGKANHVPSWPYADLENV